MFKYNITRNYTGADALGEILIMLIVSFVLGWVARIFWEKIFSGVKIKIVREKTNNSTLQENKNKDSVVAKQVVSGENIIIKPVEKIISLEEKESKKEIKKPKEVKIETKKEIIKNTVIPIKKNKKEITDKNKKKEESVVKEEVKKNIIKPTELRRPALKVASNGLNNNDLKIIEGIGPKIEILLKNANINTWEDLSLVSVEKIKSILKEGGDRFAFHDPTTWPEQAMLAKSGAWEELQEFQDFLSGGKPLG